MRTETKTEVVDLGTLDLGNNHHTGHLFAEIASNEESDRDEDGKMGMEIVKRYNAYPELIAALELMANPTVEMAGHMDLARKHAHKLLETLNK